LTEVKSNQLTNIAAGRGLWWLLSFKRFSLCASRKYEHFY